MPSRVRPLQPRLRFRARRRPAARDRRARRGAGARRPAPGAARRHRLGQDVHDGAGHRAREPADAGDGAQQDAGGAALSRSSGASFPRTPSSTSSATTTTTSPRPTSRRPTRTSRRKRRSTTRSTACGCRRRGRSSSAATSSSSPACRASTASARPRRTTACCCRSSAASGSAASRSCASWSRSSTSATTTTSAAARSACAATSSRSIPSYEEQGLRIELFGDEVDELASFDPLTGQDDPPPRQDRGLPEVALRHAARADEAGRRDDQGGAGLARGRRSSPKGKLLEAQRLHQRTMFDLEMIREIGYCHGIENYARHLTGRAPGRAAADAARLPAGRRAGHRRREPPDGAADPRHVPRRPLAQGGAGRVRLPPAVGARQPAAELRGVGGARRPGRLRVRDAGPVRAVEGAAASSSSRSSGRPA